MSHEFSLRAAGRIQRYHALPTIQRQTTADHTWHVLRVWFELYGKPSSDVAVFILLHDVGELVTGDLPHRLKQEHPKIGAAVSRIEKDCIKELIERCCIDPEERELPILSGWDLLRIKVCDLLEMAEFARDEVLMGNSQAEQILFNVASALRKYISVEQRDHEHMQVAIARLKTLFSESKIGILVI